ncbi:MAG TPA: tripartite tricarboxylate transporter substrate binding protein [Candidatus Lachnoclostridium avicola]|nr:tripartite tricarboxylate transporter substrate binding protein [Candidatus Lachnoclostridium avicola]
MRKKMMKLAALAMSAVMALSLAACGGGSGSGTSGGSGDGAQGDEADWTWERKVTLVCPWGVGGGADGTLRPLQPLLEEELGVPVEIVNVEGAGGANGVNYAYKQPADGYTYMLGTQSLIMLDLQKILPMDFKAEFIPVSKLVHSILIVGSSAKAMEGKYTNFDEFIEYAKNHPQELSCGMLTATGADSVAMKQTLAGGLGCDVTEVENYVKIVSYSSGSEMSSAMAGGHIHISISGVDEVKGLIDSGDIVPLISLSEERMSTYPEIECTGEKGIDSYIGTWRGIFCRTDTPAAAVKAMDEAIKKAWESPDYQEFLKNAVYLDREGYQTGSEFQNLIDQEYTTFEDYLKGAGLM